MKLLYFTWTCLLFLAPRLVVDSHKILVWPAEWSHWINMKVTKKKNYFFNFVKIFFRFFDDFFSCSDYNRGVACAQSYDSRDAILGVYGFSEGGLQKSHFYPVRVKLSM